MNISNDILSLKEEIAELRRALHQHPQTMFEETFAHDLVVGLLKEWGIPYTDGWAKTGIIATIEGNNTSSGKAIGLRADMDALDLTEDSGQPWCSTFPGKMHGCGHDGHTSMLLGTAKYLNEHRDLFNGTVHLIFQPGEEGGNGAEVMINEGLFDKYRCDAVFAIHNWPEEPFGKACMRSGPIMAAAQSFEIEIQGKGGHGAMPQSTIDPVLVGSHIVTALQSIVSRNIGPLDSAVVSVCSFHAGSGAPNIIPATAKLSGTLRTPTNENIPLINDKIKEISEQVASAFGATAIYKPFPFTLATVNSEAETVLAAKAAASVLGADHVDTDMLPSMGAEDFSYFLDKVPGAYIALGQGLPNEPDSPHSANLHNPKYDFNDELIPIGIAYFVEVVKEALQDV